MTLGGVGGSSGGGSPLGESAGRAGAARAAFWLYAIALFVLTHWPRLGAPDLGVQRTDLYVHVSAFGLWVVLFHASGYFGPWRDARACAWRWCIAAGYAAVDEALQAVPFIQRHAVLDDLLANLAGVTVGTILVLGVIALASDRR